MSRKNRKNLPSPQLPQNNKPVAAFIKEQYSGPLPHPEIMRQYDSIVPGLANRIIHQFEEQSKHRRELEQKVIKSDLVMERLGLIFGFIIGMASVIGGIITALLGKELAGGFIGSSGLIGLVSVFIYGTKSKRKHLDQRVG